MRVVFEGGLTGDDSRVGVEPCTRSRVTVFGSAGANEGGQQSPVVRVVMVHVNAAAELRTLYEILDAPLGELEALYDVDWDEAELRADLVGAAVVASEETSLDLELQLLKRLIDAAGPGSVLVELPRRARVRPLWAQLRFDGTSEERPEKPGLMYLFRAFSSSEPAPRSEAVTLRAAALGKGGGRPPTDAPLSPVGSTLGRTHSGPVSLVASQVRTGPPAMSRGVPSSAPAQNGRSCPRVTQVAARSALN